MRIAPADGPARTGPAAAAGEEPVPTGLAAGEEPVRPAPSEETVRPGPDDETVRAVPPTDGATLRIGPPTGPTAATPNAADTTNTTNTADTANTANTADTADTADTANAADTAATAAAVRDERDLLSLPTLPVPDPRHLVSRDASSPPPLARHRPRGGDPDDRARRGAGPAGRRKPPLRPGTLLDGGRYEVTGYLAHGGQGWIHLAEDLRLERRPLVLKGLLDPHDETARLIALEERNHLIALDNANIVRILDYVTHHPETGGEGDGEGGGPGDEGCGAGGGPGDESDGAGGGADAGTSGAASGPVPGTGGAGAGGGAAEPTDYIVMEFVGGKPLQQIIDETRQGARPLGPGEPLTLEHAARYGCKILQALEYLHGKGLLYCDMKPENVIHHADRVKVIDLGAVRRMADTTTPSIATRRFAALAFRHTEYRSAIHVAVMVPRDRSDVKPVTRD
ncbi:protein kinase, partial [Streptomyces sp. NPDC048845]|uniref:protein kinase domain-containing protein n=1 Tax=Streptomyces sp. NPDC048845 TaxID=3155390 RepID=UPI00342B07FE